MAIKIYCDLCGQEREVEQIKGVESSGSGLALTVPSMASGHFACVTCLEKIGWSANLTQTDTDPASPEHGPTQTGADGSVLGREVGRKEVKRRRGVPVVLTWKTSGEFEVLTSIAAAVDRIAEKTGTVIQGADISHALLRDRVFNADTFMVKYADEQEAKNTGNTMNATMAEAQFELKENSIRKADE